jgi:hypothetical protein
MKTLKKLLWVQLFLLTVLFTASLLVQISPKSYAGEMSLSEENTQQLSDQQ